MQLLQVVLTWCCMCSLSWLRLFSMFPFFSPPSLCVHVRECVCVCVCVCMCVCALSPLLEPGASTPGLSHLSAALQEPFSLLSTLSAALCNFQRKSYRVLLVDLTNAIFPLCLRIARVNPPAFAPSHRVTCSPSASSQPVICLPQLNIKSSYNAGSRSKEVFKKLRCQSSVTWLAHFKGS